MYKTYKVHRPSSPMKIDANWDKPQWKKVQPIDIKLYMGPEPRYMPKVQAKVLYDDKYIYVIFRVEDKFVRAVATEFHGPVWEDCCVEFFVTPGDDISKGYFNVETNCIGNILCYHQRRLDVDSRPLDPAELKQLEIATSLPKGKIINPENPKPLIWTLEYHFPIDILAKYHLITPPAPGVKWRANFYNCSEKNSNPHWLTWSLVKNDTPQFHLPEYFGTLEFAD